MSDKISQFFDNTVQTQSDIEDEFIAFHNSLLTNVSNDISSNEVNKYFGLQNIKFDSDPISWWFDNSLTFPKLSKFALKYLIIPATSVPSERLFSKTGHLVTERRNRIKSTRVEKLVMLSELNFKEFESL